MKKGLKSWNFQVLFTEDTEGLKEMLMRKHKIPITNSVTGLTILYVNHLSLVNGHWPHVDTGHLE